MMQIRAHFGLTDKDITEFTFILRPSKQNNFDQPGSPLLPITPVQRRLLRTVRV